MSFPNVAGAFWNWIQPIGFNVVTTTAVDYEANDALVTQCEFDGTIEPQSPRQLMVKAEGERKWKWWTLWTTQTLAPDAILQDETGAYYRVMKKSDWSFGEYQEYEITQAPAPPYAGS